MPQSDPAGPRKLIGGSESRLADGVPHIAMNFDAFAKAITSKNLREVAAHWQSARGTLLMPAWRDIKPRGIAAQLPIIWAYTYDRQRDEFTSRLAGARIAEIFGKSFRKMPLAETHPPSAAPWFFDVLKRVVTEPTLYRYRGAVFKHLDRSGLGERIILPLSMDGVTGDGVLGATEYSLTSRVSLGVEGEAEAWF